MYKKTFFSQDKGMKIKVYDTEIRTKDEREIRHPEFNKKGAGMR